MSAALSNLAIVEREMGRDHAAPLRSECIALPRRLVDHPAICAALDVFLTLADNQSAAAARAFHEETFALPRERCDHVAALTHFGKVALRQGDSEATRASYKESPWSSSEVRDERGLAKTLTHLGGRALDELDLVGAEALVKQGLTLLQRLRHGRRTGAALRGLAHAAEASGGSQLARDYWARGLATYEELSDRRNIAAWHEQRATLSEYRHEGDERVVN